MNADEDKKLRSYYYAVIIAIKNNVCAEFVMLCFGAGALLTMIFAEWARCAAFGLLTAAFFFIALLIAFKRIKNQHLELVEIRNRLQGTVPKYNLAYAVNIAWIVLLIAVALSPAAYFVNRQKEAARLKALMDEITAMKKTYTEVMKAEIPGKLADFDYLESVNADASLKVSRRQGLGKDGYDWSERVVITLHVSDAFDRISDNRQYEYLRDLYSEGSSAIWDVKDEKLSACYDLESRLKEQLERMNEIVSGRDSFDFFIVTSKNRYQYSHYVRDYFILNGESHYTTNYKTQYEKEHPKTTPTPKPAGSSSSGKKYVFDYDDVHNYNDPEDFWEDHEDEFDDFEDAWDYWEENQ